MNSLRGFGLFGLILLWAAPVWAVTFTTDTLIAAGDTTYDGQAIVVDGCTVTIDGPHAFESLQVVNGGSVMHPANDITYQHWLELSIEQDLTVAAGSAIQATGRGYTQNNGPGAGTSATMSGGGGGNGGNGGAALNAAGNEIAGGSAYDSSAAPTHLGSGGGSGNVNCNGGTGGGVIRLVVGGALQVDGLIAANGTDGTRGYYNEGGGGGAGGAVYLTATTLSGAGGITADGGAGGGTVGHGAGGGGGRIAIEYTTSTFTGPTSAVGGSGDHQAGGAGTVLLKPGSDPGAVLIDNAGRTPAAFTPVQSGLFAVTIAGGARGSANADVSVGALTIASSSSFGSVPLTPMVFDVQTDLVVAAGGEISVAGLGYASESGPGAGTYEWRGSGAGHGGEGGDSDSVGGGAQYGTIFEPTEFGSGGGGGGTVAGGAGGGAIRITVGDTLQVDGLITADGNDGQGGAYGTAGGGGSGGSIHLTCATFAGHGTLCATGGNGGNSNGGGGAGGRIAVYFDASNFAGALQVQGGGSIYENGAVGTAYLKPTAGTGDLLIVGDDAANAAFTHLLENGPYSLAVADGAIVIVEPHLTLGNLTVGANGTITHPTGGPALHIQAQGNATIASGGRINVNGRGHGSFDGPGAGAGEWRGSGGGHGGVGGASDYVLGGGMNDLEDEPTGLGSGGGWGYSPTQLPGGHGGGALQLTVAGTLQIDGTITANGDDGIWGAYFTASGGGAGGSVYLTAGTLTGTGTVTADGGHGHIFDAGAAAGGGSGGRIAIYTCDHQAPGLDVTVTGGLGHLPADNGTIFYGSAEISITQPPVGLFVREGDPADLTIIAQSSQGDLAVHWRKDGDPLEDDGHYSGTYTTVLHIDAALPTDAGAYDVWLTDACGSQISAAALVVVTRPGDMNCDGEVTFADINPFVDALVHGETAYGAAYPDCIYMNADIDGNGHVGFDDINPFVDLLLARAEADPRWPRWKPTPPTSASGQP